MGYFKEYPRFCSRHLWAQNEIIQGENEDLIWRFLDDIWYWAHQKISPYDPAYSQHLKSRTDSKGPIKVSYGTAAKPPLIMRPVPVHKVCLEPKPIPPLELLKPRSMLPTNMVYEKRCLSARNQFNTFGQTGSSNQPPRKEFTSSKYNFFKSQDGSDISPN